MSVIVKQNLQVLYVALNYGYSYINSMYKIMEEEVYSTANVIIKLNKHAY